MEDLEQVFLGKVKPYEDRIKRLEDYEKQKDAEILTLKLAIHNLHKIVESLKSQHGIKAVPKGGAHPVSVKPGKDSKKGENPTETTEVKPNKPTRPQTANPSNKKKEETEAPANHKKGAPAKKDKEKKEDKKHDEKKEDKKSEEKKEEKSEEKEEEKADQEKKGENDDEAEI